MVYILTSFNISVNRKWHNNNYYATSNLSKDNYYLLTSFKWHNNYLLTSFNISVNRK